MTVLNALRSVSISTLPALVVAGLGFTATTATTRGAAAMSPKFIAEMKEQCTTKKGNASTLCAAWFTTVYESGEIKNYDNEVSTEISDCFRQAKDYDLHGGSSLTGSAAERLIREKAAGKSGRDNKYVDECIRVTTAALGDQWRADVTRAAFYDRVKKTVDTDFEKKCGTRADVQSDPFRLVLWSKSKGKDAIFSGTDPEGKSIAVLCTGHIVGKTKDGRAIDVAPRTIAQVKAEEKKSCIGYCQSNDDVCVEGFRRGKTTPVCKSYCEDKCQ
jgi:hypothetical protein